MLVRNQAPRHVLSICLAASRHTTCRGARPGLGVEDGKMLNDRDGEVCKLLKFKKQGNGPVHSRLGFRRESFSSRNTFSSTTPLSPKSTATDVSPKEDPCERSQESKFRSFLPVVASSARFYGEAKRAAQGRIGASSRQRFYYAAGVGAAALVVVSGAAAVFSDEEGSVTRTRGVLLSTWTILCDSVAEFKDKMGTLLTDSIGDIVEAGSAAAVLARSLISVLLTVSEEPTIGLSSWLKPGVAALVADLVAHENRRKAVVEAGGGRVVDWLLQAVGIVHSSACQATQAEASRALAHLLSDESTCEHVLSRPHALPYLFQFASSLRVKQGFQDRSKAQGGDRLAGEGSTGKSMLVTAIVDLITSSCDAEDGSGVSPQLPGNADPGDIAVALQIIKDGDWLLDDPDRNDGDSAGKARKDKGGVQGIGITVLGSTGIVGIQRALSGNLVGSLYNGLTQPLKQIWKQKTFLISQHGYASHAFTDIATKQDWGVKRMASAEHSLDKCGLWDDLQGRHITVPLAAWALAMWAQASNANRATIAELDENGEALLEAVLAPEKTVKWHGAMAMRSLLASKSYSLTTDVAPRWSSALLNVACQASKLKDPSLANSALAALTGCVSRNKSAHSLILEEGLPVMREIAGEYESNTQVQGALAQVLDVLTSEGELLPVDESKKWAAILLKWVCDLTSDNLTRSFGARVLVRVVNNLGLRGIPISQAWLAMLLMEVVSDGRVPSAKGKRSANLVAEAKEREQLQNQVVQAAIVAAAQLAKVVAQEAAYRADTSDTDEEVAESAAELPMIDLLGLDVMGSSSKPATREALPKVTAAEAAIAVQRAVKALTELTAEGPVWRQRILDAGVLCLLRRLLLCNDYEQWAASEASEASSLVSLVEDDQNQVPQKKGRDETGIERTVCPHIRKHAARLLAVLSLQPAASTVIGEDQAWLTWLQDCAEGKLAGSNDNKTRSYALTSLLNVSSARLGVKSRRLQDTDLDENARARSGKSLTNGFWPRYEDAIFIMNPGSQMWKRKLISNNGTKNGDTVGIDLRTLSAEAVPTKQLSHGIVGMLMNGAEQSGMETVKNEPVMDVVFIHGLRGGPFKTWRVADSKTSATTPLVERIDVETGKRGTCWPQEWLGSDLPRTRLISVKYKTNLSEWSGATLPLQEVSSMLLDKLLAAGVGERPLVFVTHSMGGLVVKQMLLQAGGDRTRGNLVKNTTGIVFYSCPHFGSKLADMPWRIGYVLRPAPSIVELRSGSPRLEDLNHCLRQLHKDGHLEVLSFSETKVTPLVEGYGGWGLRMEVVPIESAYPGFGELVVLHGTDHVNSCKPLDRTDPAYTKTLEFLQKREVNAVGVAQQN